MADQALDAKTATTTLADGDLLYTLTAAGADRSITAANAAAQFEDKAKALTTTLSNKTLTQPVITLKQGAAPSNTAEGTIEWDTDDDQLCLGDGTNTRKFSDIDTLIIKASDETTALTTGDNKVRFHMPYAATIVGLPRAYVNTAPTGAGITVDIEEAGTTILSTLLTIDATETSSTTAATPAVVSDSALAANAVIGINIDQVGSTIAGKGLEIHIDVRRA